MMLSVRKRAWMIAASVVGMLAGAAQAADTVQWGVFNASSGDRLTGASQEAGNRYVLKTSAISVGDVEGLLAGQKRTDTDLQNVKSQLDAQGREFDEFKRKNGSSSNASDSQLSDLKRTVADQTSTIERQKNDIDSLKRSLDDLKRSVDTLSSKVK